MFWMPKGLVPVYLEWMLALPRAPTGSVSILVWELACASVVQVFIAAVTSAIQLQTRRRAADSQRSEPMNAGPSSGDGKKQS